MNDLPPDASAKTPPDAPPQQLTPQDIETLFGQAEPPKEDHGMSAVAPIADGKEDNIPHAIDPLPAETAPHPKAEVPLPPPTATYGAPPPTRAHPGDTLGPTPVPPPPTDIDLPPQPDIVQSLIHPQDLKALWQRADALQAAVQQHINNLHIARRLLDDIRAARNSILAGEDHYEEAARLLDEVEYQIAFSQRVRQASQTVGTKLLLYEIGIATVVGIAMFVVPWLLSRYAGFFGYKANATGLDSIQWLINGFKTMCWGSIGGTTGALYALWRHIADKQDFDPQYTMWYITNPLMGLALGAFVYIAIQAGLFSLTAGDVPTSTTAAPTFVLAWISGFQQNVAFDLVRRILKVFQITEDDDTPTAPSSPPPKR